MAAKKKKKNVEDDLLSAIEAAEDTSEDATEDTADNE